MTRFWIAIICFALCPFAFGASSPQKSVDSKGSGDQQKGLILQKRVLDIDHGSGIVEFDAIGRPGALKIHGKGAAPRGNIVIVGSSVSGAITFDLESLDTGIKMRNEHMKKKYLEIEKFPHAKLTISKVELPKDFKPEKCSQIESLPFEGILSLHGVEKSIKGISKIKCEGGLVKINSNFDLVIEDYGIATPGFAGITMARDVKVAVEVSAPTLNP